MRICTHRVISKAAGQRPACNKLHKCAGHAMWALRVGDMCSTRAGPRRYYNSLEMGHTPMQSHHPHVPRHCRATLGAGSRPIMPNVSAYNPDPIQFTKTQKEKKKV